MVVRIQPLVKITPPELAGEGEPSVQPLLTATLASVGLPALFRWEMQHSAAAAAPPQLHIRVLPRSMVDAFS